MLCSIQDLTERRDHFELSDPVRQRDQATTAANNLFFPIIGIGTLARFFISCSILQYSFCYLYDTLSGRCDSHFARQDVKSGGVSVCMTSTGVVLIWRIVVLKNMEPLLQSSLPCLSVSCAWNYVR